MFLKKCFTYRWNGRLIRAGKQDKDGDTEGVRYKEAYLAAGRLYADAKSSMSSQHVAAAIEEETGVSLSHQTVLRAGARVRAAEADGELLRVRPRGRPSILDQDQEAEIVKYIQLLRSLNLPVFSKEIRNVAFEVARKANGYTRPDGRERMSRGWLTCFFARWDLELKGTNALESDRDAYFTPANVKTHFDIWSGAIHRATFVGGPRARVSSREISRCCLWSR